MLPALIFLILILPVTPQPIEQNDWIITTEIMLSNDLRFVDNLIIKPTGKLTLKNVTLIVNYSITIERDGQLYAINSDFTSSFYFKFQIYGSAEITSSTISNLWGDTTIYPMKGGLEIYSSNVKVTGSTITKSKTFGIYIINSYPQISQNTISNNGEDGIHIVNGTPRISLNKILNNGNDGIYTTKGKPIIENNNITGNRRYGIYSYESSAIITGNTITSNGNTGIYIQSLNNIGESSHIVNNNRVENNKGWGIEVWNRDAELTSTTGFNQKGLINVRWDLTVKTLNANDATIDGVTVTIKNSYETEVERDITKSGGYTKRFSLMEYEISNDGKKSVYNPYTIIAEKGSSIVEQQIYVNKVQEIIIQFIPDITVENIIWRPLTPTEDDEIEIIANVTNLVGVSPGEIEIAIYIDGTQHEIQKTNLGGYDERQITAKLKLSKGIHKIEVVVDPANKIKEQNESNNFLSTEVFVKEKLFSPLNTLIVVIIVVVVVPLLLWYYKKRTKKVTTKKSNENHVRKPKRTRRKTTKRKLY